MSECYDLFIAAYVEQGYTEAEAAHEWDYLNELHNGIWIDEAAKMFRRQDFHKFLEDWYFTTAYLELGGDLSKTPARALELIKRDLDSVNKIEAIEYV